MVRDHPERPDIVRLGTMTESGRGGVDQMAEKVGLEDAVDALQDRGHSFQPHAGVDRGTRQRHAFILRHLFELHEDEVPEFQEAVAVLFRAAGRTAPDVFAAVDENLRAGSARAGIAHRPEIVRCRDADDAVFGEARDLLPVTGGLVVGMVDGDEQLVLLQPELPGDEVPGEFDCALLEIVAEGEIAEHLEERQMARCVADIVEVVVLASRAHALLRGGGARIGTLLQPGEDVLELHHAGIGEHQGRIVARHERARGHHLVSVLPEIVEECRPYLVYATHAVAF